MIVYFIMNTAKMQGEVTKIVPFRRDFSKTVFPDLRGRILRGKLSVLPVLFAGRQLTLPGRRGMMKYHIGKGDGAKTSTRSVCFSESCWSVQNSIAKNGEYIS